VDPRAGLEDFEEIKFLTLRGLELRPLVRPAAASRYNIIIWFVSLLALRPLLAYFASLG
jgi:hypothetical protein